MVDVRRALAEGWAPSVSVAFHAAVLMAALFLYSHPTPTKVGDKPIPVALMALPAPVPPSSQPEPVVAPKSEPPPVTTTAESAPVAAPIQKPIRKSVPKILPKPGHEPAPAQPEPQPTAEPSAPSNIGAVAHEGPGRSVEPRGPPPSYLASLRQKLERNKVYPRAARQRRQEGTAILHFVIDRDGHVLSRRLEKSTGYGDLDHEVEAMLERAQPLPPMPAEMTQVQLEIAVPVDFHLR